MRELKKNINEGTEMGEIGNVQIDQFAGSDGLMVQLTPINGERHVQMDKPDAQKVAQRLMKWSSSKERAMPGEYESVEEAVGDFADPIYDLIDELGDSSIVLDNLIRYLDGDTIEDFVDDFRRHHDMPKRGEAEESVTEAEGRRVIKVNQNIDLAGDSIYQGEKRGEEVTYKTFVHEITINTDEDGYMSVTVKHEVSDYSHTDSGFEEEISGIIGTPVSFSEQGMQDDGMAHLEGEEETKQE